MYKIYELIHLCSCQVFVIKNNKYKNNKNLCRSKKTYFATANASSCGAWCFFTLFATFPTSSIYK